MADEYTWDENKRAKNFKKHGLDFEGVEVFDWDYALTRQDTDSDQGEARYVSIGYLRETLVVLVWCYRESTTRIISLRKAKRSERKQYEK